LAIREKSPGAHRSVGVFLAACFGETILHMSDQRLGRLERVELRDIWTNETNALRVALRD
jgi:hypothetical protein